MRTIVGTLLLLVMAAACTNGQQNSARTNANDAYLTVAVKAKLAGVDVDSATAVGVNATHGTVTLTGQARSAGERQAYANAARTVSGVTSVVDRVSVNPHLNGIRQQAGDAALAARVAAAIAGQAGVNVFHVKTSARGGVVTLSGIVPTRSVARTIAQTARGVSGVRRVVDRIRVRG